MVTPWLDKKRPPDRQRLPVLVQSHQMLEEDIPDELKANRDYIKLADALYTLGEQRLGDRVSFIARQENQHHDTLLEIQMKLREKYGTTFKAY